MARRSKKPRRERPIRRFLIVTLSTFAVTALAGLGWYLWNRTNSVSETTLELWVKEQRFSPLRPIQSNYLPGTLVRLSNGGRDQIAMSGKEFLGKLTEAVTSSVSADVVLDVHFKGKVSLTGGDTAPNTKNAGSVLDSALGLEAKLALSNVSVLSLPLSKISDAVASNERVRSALASNPDDLFVVLEALQVGRMKFTFSDNADNSLKAQLSDRFVRPTFGGSLNFGAKGDLSSSQPLVVGASLARLIDVNNRLGGRERTITVQPYSPQEIEEFRSAKSARDSRLSSAFDLYACVIALGNYPSASTRAGGLLPDAIGTGEWVATTLRHALPDDQASHVHLITSVEESTGSFDRTKRRSRREILASIDACVAEVRRTGDPSREALIVFYFFGHGLADGISKNVFLVPETFVDDESRKVIELAPKLVGVDDVAARLSQATDHILVLVDACREHKDESSQLIEAWKEGLNQTSDLAGILGALQFASGIYGPHPMLFGAEDGISVPTVPLPERGLDYGTGPLAILLDRTLSAVSSDHRTLTLSEFVRDLQQPIEIPGQARTIRAHTYLRSDFLAELSTIPLVSSMHQDVAIRSRPFHPPASSLVSHLGTEPPRTATMESGARAREILRLNDADVIEIAASPEAVWALDDAQRVWQITVDGAATVVNEGLPASTIGWDQRLGLVLGQWDESRLYHLVGKQWTTLIENVRGSQLVPDGSDDLWLRSEDFADKHDLLKLGNGFMETSRTVVSDELLDAIPEDDGGVCVVGAQRIFHYREGEQVDITNHFWKPSLVRVQGRTLYFLSEEARMLFRVLPSHEKAELDLFDVGIGDAYIRRYGCRGFAFRTSNTVYIAAGPAVVRIDLTNANWRNVD